MADTPPPSPVPPGGVRFPGTKPGAKPLALPRRRVVTRSPFEVSEASANARRQIEEIVSATRAPWSGEAGQEKAAELERSLRQLEMKLAERERHIEDTEVRLAEREREIAEAEALQQAREKLLRASQQHGTGRPHATLSKEEQTALEQLKLELDRQERALEDNRDALKEREAFLDESEVKLFEKVQAQQEKETELEQREEDLATRERRLVAREAAIDPAAAAALKAQEPPKKNFDEFNE